MGTSLQASPCPKALPPARRLDCAAHSVASMQAVAERSLATVAGNQAVWRVRAGELDSVDPFDCISESVSLRESCMRENRTYSLSGGRWLARKCASSDPTPTKRSNEGRGGPKEIVEGRP